MAPPTFSRIAACGFAAILVGFSLWHMFQFRVPFPFWDMIPVEAFLDEHFDRGWSLAGLVTITQNEHRPVFPLLLWIADHTWFASAGVLVIAVDAALLAAMSALLMGWMRSATRPGSRRVALMAAVPVLIFWPAQGENLTWPVQANSVFSLTALLMALHALLVSERASSDPQQRGRCLGWLALTILLLFVATYSLAFGLVGWPLLVTYLLLRRRPWWMIALLAAAGLGSVAPYAAFWVDVPHHAHALSSALEPSSVARYFFGLLGAPVHKLIEWPYSGMSAATRGIAGAAIFALAVGAAHRVLLRAPADDASRERQADAALALIAVLGLGCAFLIALGRHNFGVAQSLSSRYTIIPCLVWLGAAGYWIPRLPAPRPLAVAGRVTAWLLSGVIVASYVGHAARSRDFATWVRVAAMTEVAGITHPDLKPRLYKGDASREWLFESLRRRGHPFFDEPWPAWVGHPASDLFGEPVARRCYGRIDSTSRLGREIVQMKGWAWDTVIGAPPALIVAVDEDGIVRGLGASGFERNDVFRFFSRLELLNAGWIAAARTPDALINVLGVTADGRSCSLTQVTVPLPWLGS